MPQTATKSRKENANEFHAPVMSFVERQRRIRKAQIEDSLEHCRNLDDFRRVVGPLILHDTRTWKRIGELSNLSATTVRKLAEGETREPRFSTLAKLAPVYGLHLFLAKVTER